MKSIDEHNHIEREVSEHLRQKGLRITAPCLAVLHVLADSNAPLSHSEVLDQINDIHCDPATVYRNLIKLRDAGLAAVASQTDRVDRYVLNLPGTERHLHPHFSCTVCGRIECLPTDIMASMNVQDIWQESIQEAICDLRGTCPTCREKQHA